MKRLTLRGLIHITGKYLLRLVGNFQSRHSLIPTTPFLENHLFKCTEELEKNWKTIKAELDIVWKNPEKIPSFHQISPDQSRISKGENWKTFAFYIFKEKIIENCNKCPKTAQILKDIDGLQNAWFSILAPKYKVPPHKGPTKALVRCHLGLKIPLNAENCWIRVSDIKKSWREGECMFFDDTYEHEVFNDTNEARAVLFLDLDRPMDSLGKKFNSLLLSLVKSSHYVKDPLKNLKAWSKNMKNETVT